MADLAAVSDSDLAAEVARRECAHGGHAPSHGLRSTADWVAPMYFCDCGRYAWRPEVQGGNENG